MQSKRYKRKTAYALSRQLRRRFYIGAAIATSTYVLLSLVKFHAQVTYLANELAIIWAVSLLCYTSLREILRWNAIDEREHRGEIWAAVVVAGALWMMAWNMFRTWILHLSAYPFPEDYLGATAETIVLYTISVLSSFLYKYKKRRAGQHAHKRMHGKAEVVISKSAPATKSEQAEKPVKVPEVSMVLTKSPPSEEKENQNKSA